MVIRQRFDDSLSATRCDRGHTGSSTECRLTRNWPGAGFRDNGVCGDVLASWAASMTSWRKFSVLIQVIHGNRPEQNSAACLTWASAVVGGDPVMFSWSNQITFQLKRKTGVRPSFPAFLKRALDDPLQHITRAAKNGVLRSSSYMVNLISLNL